MKFPHRLLAVASAAFFIATSALAQNAGTVTNHAFALGKGAGQTGYTSLLCGSAQLAVGQSAADPICKTITGDVTITAAGVTAIGATKVTNAMLAAMAANTTKCNATAGSAVPTDCTASTMRTNIGVVIGTNVQAWDADLDCIAANSTAGLMAYTGAGTCSYRTLTAPAAGFTITNPAGTAGNPTFVLANDLAALEGLSSTGIARRTGTDAWSVGTAVTNAELATMAANTVKANATAGSATPTDVTLDSTLAFSAGALKCTTGTASQLGCLKPDGTTITVASGVITASGGSATAITPGTTSVIGGATLGYLYSNGTTLGNAVPISLMASVAAPTATTNATGVMMGMGSTCHMAPAWSGRLQVTFSGYMNASTAVFMQAQFRYGTGTAPTNGAALTGTTAGLLLGSVPNATNSSIPYSKTVVLTGLTPGTAYWFDMSLSSNNGTSVSLVNNDCAGIEF